MARFSKWQFSASIEAPAHALDWLETQFSVNYGQIEPEDDGDEDAIQIQMMIGNIASTKKVIGGATGHDQVKPQSMYGRMRKKMATRLN